MHPATTINGSGTNRGGSFGKLSFPGVGLSVTGAILLATRFYFVRELLALLAALAVLFAVGTGAVVLVVLLHEGERWSVRHIIEARRRITLFRGGPGSEIKDTSVARVLTTAKVAISLRGS